MSTYLSTRTWCTPLKGYQKLILLALADYADEKGWCSPSLTDISRKCGISQSSTIEHLKLLIKKRLIFKVRRCYDPSHQQTNLYKLNLSCFSGFSSASSVSFSVPHFFLSSDIFMDTNGKLHKSRLPLSVAVKTAGKSKQGRKKAIEREAGNPNLRCCRA